MKYDIDSLNKISIIDIARELGIDVKGKKAHCFLHDDRNPSLSFDTQRNIWKCFGCNQGGNVIELVKRRFNVEFKGACQWIEHNFNGSAYRSGATVNRNQYYKIQYKQRVKNSDEQQSDSELYEAMISHLTLSQVAENYLCKERALSIDVIKSHNIVSIENTRKIYNWLCKNFSAERLLSAGLIQKGEGGKLYNFWRFPGIVFPYYDINKKITNLQLRPYAPLNNQKYIFLKGIRTCMYNENALVDLPRGESVYLCEGAIDALSLMTMDFIAVGIPGVATLKNDWIRILRNFNVFLVFDNDDAGKRNAQKHMNTLKTNNINVQSLDISPYNDVNEKLTHEKGEFK